MAKVIEVEGTDGAGKTTGLTYLIKKLQSLNKNVLETREVGSPLIPACVELRKIVLNPESNMPGTAMEMVFAAMRILNQDLYSKVGNNYDYIVSDRGWLSHLAYTDHNVDTQFTEKFYDGVVGPLTKQPDIVLYFSVNTETALKRRVKRGTGMDVIEMKGVEFQELVRGSFEKYIKTALTENTKVFVIDANQSVEGVQAQLDEVVAQLTGAGNV
jgi:dTMP kinase